MSARVLGSSRKPSAPANGRVGTDHRNPAPRSAAVPESFPEVVVGCGLTCQIVDVDPALAAQWLALVRKDQRNKKKAHLRSLGEDVKAGRFRLNGETIIFDRDGRMTNGQHRLTVVVETGVTIRTLVVRGVDVESYPTIDISAKRTGSDALKSSGHENYVALAAAAKLLVRHDRGMIGKEYLVLSPIAIEEIVANNPGLAESVSAVGVAQKLCRSAGAPGFCHYMFAQIDRADADAFFAKLITGENLRKDDPILSLRNRLAREVKKPGDEVISLLFHAWNASRKGYMLRVASGSSLPELI